LKQAVSYADSYVGTIGKREKFSVTLKGVYGYVTDYGYTTILTFQDKSGCCIVWKASSTDLTVTSTTVSVNVPNLINGTSYTFTVTANAAGGTNGTPSAASTAVIPNSPPFTPSIITALAGASSAPLTWFKPTVGTTDVDSYTITSTTGTMSPLTVLSTVLVSTSTTLCQVPFPSF
jgi:hypothetical protein